MVMLSMLRQEFSAEWAEILTHPFLDHLRSGDLRRPTIRAWLTQDYFFVEAILRFQAILLTKAPRAHQIILAQGLVGLIDELDWLDTQELDTSPSPHTARERYITFLSQLADEPYQLGLFGLWALQWVFLDTWSAVGPTMEPFSELVEHWTAKEFQAYVYDLGEITDEALRPLWEKPLAPEVRRIMQLIMDHELATWDMALSFMPQYRSS